MTPTDPPEPLWGPETERARAVLSFSGRTLGSFPSLVRALGSVKVAAAKANASAGTLDPAAATAVETAARRLRDGQLNEHLVVDPLGGGGGIGVHQNVNEVLATIAGCGPAEVGASQSTADVCHTAARLAVLDDADKLDAAVVALVAELTATAGRFDGVETLARTCLQDGLAVPARLLFDGAAAAAERRRTRLCSALESLNQVVLGATVIGTGTGAAPAYRAAVVGVLSVVTGRPLTAHAQPASALQYGDDLADVSGSLVGLAAVLAKLAQDLRLLSSGPAGGFGELRLPKVMDGSSFFIDKNNPVVPETMIQAALAVNGLDATVRAAAGRAELHLHGYDLTAAVALMDALAMLTRAVNLLRLHALAELTLDEDRCAQLAEFATAHKEMHQ